MAFKFTQGVAQKYDVVAVTEILEVVRLVDGRLVLVEHVDHFALETDQLALDKRKSGN